jgi:YVTN family beta-propeller protein
VNGAPSSEAAGSGPRGLQFKLLGPLEASRDGVRIDLGPRKQRAVLALLLLNANRVVPTDRLIDDLWGDSPPDTARSALQVYVAGLRKALGRDGEALRTRPPGYVLELEPGALDLDRFVELRTEARACADDERKAALLHDALALWRDTPLAELRTEPFSTSAAAQLEQLQLGALEERIDADLELGRHAALVPELEARVAEHPYREHLCAQLMLALYRSGRQAEALDAYQAARRTLRDELGLKPGRELRELEAAILRQDETLGDDSWAPKRPRSEVVQPSDVGLRPVTAVFPIADGAGVSPPLPPRRRRPSALRGRPTLLLMVVIAGLVAAATAALALREEPVPITVLPNSIAVIDPGTDRVVETFSAGVVRPGPIVVGGDSVWIGSLDDKALSRFDPATGQLVETVPLRATPTDLAFGAGALWVSHGLTGELSRVDPQFGDVTTIHVTDRSLYYSSSGVAVGAGWVWAVYGDSTLARLAPHNLRRSGSTRAGEGSADVVFAGGSIWVINTGDATVQRFNATTFEEGPVQPPISVGRSPTGVAASGGTLWVASTGDDVVTRIDTGSRSTFTIPVGDGPTAVAVGTGAVWVTNTAAGTVSRIDPATNEVVRTIDVGGAPAGIAVVDDAVWVAVQAP